MALAISLSGHLFLLFFVTIIVVPVTFQKPRVYTVSFLGPILEKTAFEIMIDKNMDSEHEASGRPMYFSHSSPRFTDPLIAGGKRDVIQIGSGGAALESFKISPPFQHTDVQIKQAQQNQKDFLIEGPLARREILFKPQAPVVPERLGLRQESFIVEVKIEVPAAGNVDKTTLLASSGYPDIDLAAIKYVKGLKFSPRGPEAPSAPEGGKIKINLKSK